MSAPLLPPRGVFAITALLFDTGLEPEVAQALEAAGVFKFLLPEVARTGRSAAALLALLAWRQADSPEQPGGFFMARLRGGVATPRHPKSLSPR